MPCKPDVWPKTLLAPGKPNYWFFEKLKLVPNTKVGSLDTYIILKETSSATGSVFSISRAAKAMDLNISPLI